MGLKIIQSILALLVWSGCLMAQVVFEIDDQHRGILWLEKFQIYPENRLGNGLYHNQDLIASEAERRILEIFDIPDMESVIYLYDDAKNNQGIGLHTVADRTLIKRVDQEFFEVIDRKTWYRKLFRIYQNHIQAVFPAAKTATGLTPSQSHVAFYHISASEAVGAEEDGKEKRLYTFQLHVINRKKGDKPYPLKDVVIQGFSSYIRLAWLDTTQLQYTIAGQTHTINVKAQAPHLY